MPLKHFKHFGNGETGNRIKQCIPMDQDEVDHVVQHYRLFDLLRRREKVQRATMSAGCAEM